MLASWYGHLNVVKYLAENGANINVKATFWGGKFIFAFDGTAAFIYEKQIILNPFFCILIDASF